jgi:PmbA protein
MLKTIVAAAGRAAGVSAWLCLEDSVRRSERYYIGRRLDTARSSEVRTWSLTLYVDREHAGERLRGASTCRLHPGMDQAALAEAVGRCAFAAAQATAPWFPLVEPAAPPAAGRPALAEGDADAWLDRAAAALFAPPDTAAAGINNLELFLIRERIRLVSSAGVDYAREDARLLAEFIVEAPDGHNGVELFRTFERADADPAALRTAMEEALAQAADRARAVPTPAAKELPVVLRGEAVPTFLDYFLDRTNVQAVYQKVSDWRAGSAAQAAGAADPISVVADPGLPVVGAKPFDADGKLLAPTPLVAAGVVAALWGESRYAHYLGLPAVGDHNAFAFAPGSLDAAAVAAGPCLEVLAFSDFRADPVSGAFGGEIRLAYLVDAAGARTPVYGGTATGMMADNLADLRLARDRETFSAARIVHGGSTPVGYLAPNAVRLLHVGIAGSEA